ncbi:MAG: phage virion morphogenesis protein [Alphaproteobacteria bacterium]
MTVSVRIEVDDAEVRQALQALQERGKSMRPLMRDIGSYMVTSTLDNFERQQSPDGKPWQLLAASTVIARLGGAKKVFTKKGSVRKPAMRRMGKLKILQLSGRLRQSITYRADRDEVLVGTNVIYARIHQFGGEAGRRLGGRSRMTINGLAFPVGRTAGRRARIPARPFLGISERDRVAILDTMREYVAEAWK